MRLAVTGAAGFIGSEVVTQALESGHRVSALSRRAGAVRPRPDLEVVLGDATDPIALARMLVGVDAVISCVGGTENLAALMAALLDAMNAAPVRRLVAISGAGITVPGEHKPLRHRIASGLVRLLASKAVSAKQAEYEVLASSRDVDWVSLRPPRVVDGPASGKARPSLDAAEMAFRVTRADVAAVILQELTDDRFLGQPAYIASA